jgi:hypothetical protein
MLIGITTINRLSHPLRSISLGSLSLRVVTVLAVLLASGLFSSPQVLAETSPFASGPKTIASKERVTVLIDREVKESKSFIILKISVPTDSKANAFMLSDPARLVVDLEGASVKKSENFPAPENGVIKQIRLGAHPSKLRVVVDLIKSTPPEYDWKSDKRTVTVTFIEGAAAPAPVAQTAALPTAAPTIVPTMAPQPSATSAPVASTPVSTPVPATATPVAQATEASVAQDEAASAAAAGAAAASIPSDLEAEVDDDSGDLGDLEATRSGPPPTRVPTSFTIKGYKFEYLPDKSPVLKILLNKPRAQAQISKVDAETYAISIKDCGVANEDLELPQFPPHDFVGFVMVVSEIVGGNTEVSVSVEEGVLLATSVHDNEIWVKKP